MKVNVFLSSKKEGTPGNAALAAFYEFLASSGITARLVDAESYESCDVAVLFGSPKERRPVRQSIRDNHAGPTIVLEAPFLGRTIRRSEHFNWRRLFGKVTTITDEFEYCRIALGGTFRTDGEFLNAMSPDDRWQMLRGRFGLAMQPYRKVGGHILLIGQVPGDLSLQGLDIVTWLGETARALSRLTERTIRIRPHPKTKSRFTGELQTALKGERRITLADPKNPIQTDLEDCWAMVCHSSSSSLESLLAGVPVIALSENNAAWPASDHILSRAEDPTLHPRDQLFSDLSYAQWSLEEIRRGLVWKRFQPRILEMLQSRPLGSVV